MIAVKHYFRETCLSVPSALAISILGCSLGRDSGVCSGEIIEFNHRNRDLG